MLKARVTKSFRRRDTREYVRRGKSIEADAEYIKELERNRLVEQVAAIPAAPENKAAKADPVKPAGEKLSASQAGRVSRQTKSKKSAGGGKKAKKAKTKEA